MRFVHLLSLLVVLTSLVACTGPVAERGDSVLITYVGRFDNGTIFDTNDPAMSYALPGAPAERFVPLPVKIGSGQMISGFDSALVGMHKSETKVVYIKAVDAYGAYDPAKTTTIPRALSYPLETQVNRTITVDLESLPDTTNLTIGVEFEGPNFRYKVLTKNATHVQLYAVQATHDPIQSGDVSWNTTLIATTPAAFTYRHVVSDGDIVITSQGPYTALVNGSTVHLSTTLVEGTQIRLRGGVALVTSASKDTLKLDLNHPLAGRDLNFTITMNDIQKP